MLHIFRFVVDTRNIASFQYTSIENNSLSKHFERNE